ncbi:hypothetical protein FRB94_005973 [Tulasnella sp. JGI-2019a]|nr:hypothetical protein FRB94_005973 [Tulasnella sp. JGI-2019a]
MKQEDYEGLKAMAPSLVWDNPAVDSEGDDKDEDDAEWDGDGDTEGGEGDTEEEEDTDEDAMMPTPLSPTPRILQKLRMVIEPLQKDHETPIDLPKRGRNIYFVLALLVDR